jgi:hypothetical protein
MKRSSKFQAQSSKEGSRSKLQLAQAERALEFEAWSFFGTLIFEL